LYSKCERCTDPVRIDEPKTEDLFSPRLDGEAGRKKSVPGKRYGDKEGLKIK
jgi:hypothetical protein